MWIGPQDHKVVGACLEVARVSSGVTQQQLAHRLGKPQSFISTYESGQRRVDVLEFLTIMAALGRDPQPVFGTIADQATSIVTRTLGRVG